MKPLFLVDIREKRRLCYYFNINMRKGQKMTVEMIENCKKAQAKSISREERSKRTKEMHKKGIFNKKSREKQKIGKLGDKNPMFGIPKDRHPMFGRKHSKETRRKMRENHKGMTGKEHSAEWVENMKGENNPCWVEDRTQLKRREQRNDSLYQDWRKNVLKRDNKKCKINNRDCKDRLEVHHILGWSEYPELRYNINNGITLCKKHHPRKKEEEVLLIPTFKELILIK